MAETPGAAGGETLLSAEAIAAVVEDVAAKLAPRLRPDAVMVCLLTGGIWFAADLSRALHRRGLALAFDALWLASYGDERTSGGAVDVRAGLQRPVAGRQVLVVDDVMDSGVSLAAAHRLLNEAGAAEVLTCVLALKPWPGGRRIACDVYGWAAPARFLAGYGMDAGGAMRGCPDVVALD